MDETCARLQQLMIPYLQRQLTTTEVAALMRHLSTCPGCRREMAGWVRLSKQLNGLTEAVPPKVAATVFELVPIKEPKEVESILSNPLSPFIVIDLLRYLLAPAQDSVRLALKLI